MINAIAIINENDYLFVKRVFIGMWYGCLYIVKHNHIFIMEESFAYASQKYTLTTSIHVL